jgi:hypothetical protein
MQITRMTTADAARPDRCDPALVSGDAVRAGAAAALLSGAPSALWALLGGTDPLAPSLAAGRLLLPGTTRRWRLLVAAAGGHAALSLGWAQVLAVTPGRQGRSVTHGALWGAAGGLAIAALDLGLAHTVDSPRLSGVRGLPVLPQLADHLAFGAVVGAALARHEATRCADRLPARGEAE